MKAGGGVTEQEVKVALGGAEVVLHVAAFVGRMSTRKGDMLGLFALELVGYTL